MRTLPLIYLVLLCPAALAAASEPDLTARWASLEGSGDAQAWYRLAADARIAGNIELASRALEAAADLDLPPARLALERARLEVAREAPAAAITELQELAASGFTAIGAIVDDPVLSSLSGHPQYAALVDTLSAKAYPCEHQERFREFDFWIGEWEVRTADGRIAGHNVIEASQHGCVLVENWTSAVHGSGMSMNYLDHATGEWVQIWTDAGGGQIDIRGGTTEGGMLLEGRIRGVDGIESPFRGLWTPLPDGRVRQFFEQSTDGGETWEPWFEGYYSRIDEQP